MTGAALDGVRVLELASEHGAFAGKILADLGADVVLVEPRDGHRTRWYEPFFDDEPSPEGSLWFWHYNTGKRSITLDLDGADDARRFTALVAASDIVIEAEMPGRLAALGLDYEDVGAAVPALVWVSITPFGRATAAARQPATDLTILAGAGAAWSCGYDDHSLPPVRPGGNQAIHTACLWGAMGALTAFHVSETTGLGQFVDVSMHAASNVTTEAATYEWLVAGATVQRQTFRHAAVRPTQPRLTPSSDGRHVIGALPRSAAEFRTVIAWLAELGLTDEIDDFVFLEMAVARGGILIPEVETDAEVAAIYQAGRDALWRIAEHLPAREFFVSAQRRGLPVGVLYAPEDVMEDEHFAARGFPIEIRHDDLGRTFVYPGAPFRASATPWQVRGRAPHIGEHSEAVWRAIDLDAPTTGVD